MINNGNFMVYKLSELPAHWRMVDPKDMRLLDYLRLIALIGSYERFPNLPVNQRFAHLTSLNIKIIDDRSDQHAQTEAVQRDLEGGWSSKVQPIDIATRLSVSEKVK